MSQGDENVAAEIPVFSKHKWLKTGLKSSGSNRRRLKGTILLWFIVLRKVVMCSTLAKDFSWALSLAAGTMHCRKSLLSVSSFSSMTWLLLLLTEKGVMAHEQSVCHNYSVREDEQGEKSPGEAETASRSHKVQFHCTWVRKASASAYSIQAHPEIFGLIHSGKARRSSQEAKD